MAGIGKVILGSGLILMLILSVQITYQPIKVVNATCDSSHPYLHNDGKCWNVPQCSGDHPYGHTDGLCWNVPQCSGDHPYGHTDGLCWNVPQKGGGRQVITQGGGGGWRCGGPFMAFSAPAGYYYTQIWVDGQYWGNNMQQRHVAWEGYHYYTLIAFNYNNEPTYTWQGWGYTQDCKPFTFKG